MRSKAILMALLAFAIGGVEAAPVSREQAAAAVRKWVRSGHHLGTRHGTEVEKSATLTTDGGRKFHAVKLKGRGTVFTSSDTDSEPIVAFTSSSEDFSNIDKKSPLWALLSRDAEVRANIRAYRAAAAASNRLARARTQMSGATSAATSSAADEDVSAASRRWARLLAADAPVDPAKTSASAPRKEDESEIDDIRRSPLVQTRWSQTTHNDGMEKGHPYYIDLRESELEPHNYIGPFDGTGKPCYNYYTPTALSGPYVTNVVHGIPEFGYYEEHTPCGCTATATAQLMRFFEFPRQSVPSQEFACEVSYHEQMLTTIGGTYDWAKMAFEPANGVTDEQAEAIGHLTYDVGVALGSEYTPGNTSAVPYDIPAVLTGYFGYRNAICLWNSSLINEATTPKEGEMNPSGYITSGAGLHNPKIRRNVVYTNLDHRQPVIFGIYGFNAGHVGEVNFWSGHAVVGDGYGFLNFRDEETGEATNTVEYVHINMGWSGSDDAWYNIPEIDAVETGASGADRGFSFTVMAAAIYNVFTNETGEIVSGRVFKDGEPVSGVTVMAGRQTAVTDEKGIYALIVPSASNCVLTAYYDRDNFEGTATANVKTSKYAAQVGNVWGADIELLPSSYAGTVRRNGDDSLLYGSVDAAYAEAADGDRIEVLAPTRLRSESFAFAKNVTLTATNAVPDANPIKLRLAADVSVASGARLALTNVAFCGGTYQVLSNIYTHTIVYQDGSHREEERIEIPQGYDLRYYTNVAMTAELGSIRVERGAKVAVAGALTIPELDFADENGFELAGHLFDFLKIRVPSFARGARVGVASCAEETAIAASAYVVNPEDRFLTAVPMPYPTLKWDLAHVEDADLVATLKVAGDERTYRYSDLDRLLQDAGEGDAAITLYRSCSLTKPLTVASRTLVISGVGEWGSGLLTVGNIGSEAGFTIGDGGSLCVSNLYFHGYTGNALFFVNGQGAQLTLEKGSWLHGLNGTNTWSGAVAVKKGTVTMQSGSLISECTAMGSGLSVGKGGGVFLNGNECALNLFGGAIKSCQARATDGGGGVYAYRGSTVNVKGAATVSDNWSGYQSGNPLPDDIQLVLLKNLRARLVVVDELLGGSSVGVRCSSNLNADGYGSKEGKFFADIDESCGETAVLSCKDAFFSNTDTTGLMVEVAESGEQLQWVATPAAGQRTDPMPGDVARIVRSATETNFFDRIAKAFAAVDADGLTVELLADTSFEASITVSHDLTLRSADGLSDPAKLRRISDASIVVPAGAGLTVSNLTVDGGATSLGARNAASMLFAVCGGSLTLGPGAEVRDVDGAGNRAAGAVVVSANGVFTMTNAVIRNCRNSFVDIGNATGVGAGLLVDKGTAYLYGGTVTDCTAYRASGVCIGNGGSVYVLGEMNVTGNTALSGAPSDFTVENLEALYLSEELTGDASIGIEDGIFVDTNVFGRVDGAYSKSVSNLVASAALFFRDSDPEVKGLIVTNADEALLVWSSAVRADGIYVDKGGQEYMIVAQAPEPQVLIPVAIPTAVDGLVYNALEQTGVVAVAEGYLLTGNTATNAGTYRATAQLSSGYKWSDDGTTVPKEIAWSIAKATYDMSGVVFTNVTYVCDGTAKSNLVDEATLPAGVSVTNYLNNGQTEVDEYTVTAQFGGDEVNYEAIPDMTATLTIIEDPTPPDPPPGPTPEWTTEHYTPSNIAFKVIERVSDTLWHLVITDRTEYCNYRLLWTDDLTKGFTSTGAWEHAVGEAASKEWTTNVITTGGAWFWRAEGTEGTNMVPPQVSTP